MACPIGVGVRQGSPCHGWRLCERPEVNRIVIGEIEPSVLGLSDRFTDENHGVRRDPWTDFVGHDR